MTGQGSNVTGLNTGYTGQGSNTGSGSGTGYSTSGNTGSGMTGNTGSGTTGGTRSYQVQLLRDLTELLLMLCSCVSGPVCWLHPGCQRCQDKHHLQALDSTLLRLIVRTARAPHAALHSLRVLCFGQAA